MAYSGIPRKSQPVEAQTTPLKLSSVLRRGRSVRGLCARSKIVWVLDCQTSSPENLGPIF